MSLKAVLSELRLGDTLISFNWDTLAETILCTVFGADVVQLPYPTSSEKIRLAKPHGSLSWIHRGDQAPIYRDGPRVRLTPMNPGEVCSGGLGSCQPLILGALPIKNELLEEVQRTEPGLHDLVVDQWKEVVDAVLRSTELMVVGYRSPPEDEYGRFLMREAVRKRLKDPPLSIRYFSLVRDREEFERAFRHVFGTGIAYTYCGEVTEALH